MEWPRRTLGKCEVLTLLTASGRSDQSHRLAPVSITPYTCPQNPREGWEGKDNTTHTRKGALTTARPLLVNACLTGETCAKNFADIFYTASGSRAESQLHPTKRIITAKWTSGPQNALHIFSQARIKIHASWKYVPLLLPRWMEWPRRTLGKCEVLTLLTASGRSDQSHRLAPMLWSDLPRKQNLCTQCSREDCEQGIIPTDKLDPEEMRCVMAESSRLSCLHLNSIVSMTLYLVFSEASSACSVDTIDGQLFIDLIFQCRKRRRALRQHLPDLSLEYEPRPPKKWNREVDIKPCRRFRQNFPREYEYPSPHTLVTSAKV